MKPDLVRLPLLPRGPKVGDAVTVVTGGVVIDLRWNGTNWVVVVPKKQS